MNFRNIRGFSKGEIKRYRVVLFDVDGTIMYSSRDIGGQAMINAMEKTFCKQKKPFSRENIRLGGRCDPIIAEEVAYKAGVTMETFASKHSDFIREYKVELEKQIQLNRDIVTQTEGIANLLRSLQTKGVKLGVLTGNYNEIAPVKISAVHIDPNVFEFGAFGSDDSDRNALPKIALRRAAEYLKCSLEEIDAIIVGDTIEDIECAKVNGIPVLAVATGFTPVSELLSKDPDYCFTDLGNLEMAVDILTNGK